MIYFNYKCSGIVKTCGIVQYVGIPRAFFILLFMYHSENFQKCGVYVRFDFASHLSSEEESLHTLSKRQQ